MKKESSDKPEELQPSLSGMLQLEKMAVLGRMTAGIIHEIKNPLNFVINYSVISADALEDLDEKVKKLKELDGGEALASELSSDSNIP